MHGAAAVDVPDLLVSIFFTFFQLYKTRLIKC